MKEFKGYKCDHCGKLYQMKHACKKHEEIKCPKNPNNAHPCWHCPFMEVSEAEFLVDAYGGEFYRKQKTFFCTKKDVNLYSFKFDEHIKSFDPALSDEMKPTERMPKYQGCDIYTDNEKKYSFMDLRL